VVPHGASTMADLTNRLNMTRESCKSQAQDDYAGKRSPREDFAISIVSAEAKFLAYLGTRMLSERTESQLIDL
jgi:hypothetical protein